MLLANRIARSVKNLAASRVVIKGYHEFLADKTGKRALLSYLVHPLLPPPSYREKIQFSNRGIAQELARALNELGYIVDIVDYQNRQWLPRERYDLFVGHGGFNFQRLSEYVKPGAPKIYFSTGIYWRELNIRAAFRVYQLALRRGYIIPPERYVDLDEEYANLAADGIICLGNAETGATYAKFPRVHCLNNAAFPIDGQPWLEKDYNAGRKHFFFFSGRGNVHRGLDLLLEAFAGTDLHLHICQHIEPEFARIYRRELTELSNIHLRGFVSMRSPEFEALTRTCNWTILPTCAEGQPGSVIECMAHGLIPILPQTASIDLGNFGLDIPALDVETIRSVICAAAQLDADECRNRSLAAVDAVAESYTVEAFRTNLKTALCRIISSAEQQPR